MISHVSKCFSSCRTMIFRVCTVQRQKYVVAAKTFEQFTEKGMFACVIYIIIALFSNMT